MAKTKNAAAVALSKLRMKRMTAEERQDVARQGGLAGGAARAEKLSAKKRSEIAKKGALARWGKKTAKVAAFAFLLFGLNSRASAQTTFYDIPGRWLVSITISSSTGSAPTPYSVSEVIDVGDSQNLAVATLVDPGTPGTIAFLDGAWDTEFFYKANYAVIISLSAWSAGGKSAGYKKERFKVRTDSSGYNFSGTYKATWTDLAGTVLSTASGTVTGVAPQPVSIQSEFCADPDFGPCP